MSLEQVSVGRGPEKKKSRKETVGGTLKDDLTALQGRFDEKIADVDKRLQRHRYARELLRSPLSIDDEIDLAKGLGERTAFPIHEDIKDELWAEREEQIRNRDILKWGMKELTTGGIPDAPFVRLMNAQAKDLRLEIGGKKRKLAEVQAKRASGEKMLKFDRIALNNLPAEIGAMEGRVERISRLAESVENVRTRVKDSKEISKLAEEDDTDRRSRVRAMINKMGGYKKNDDRYEA